MKSVEQKPRTLQDVQQEYARTCANAGQLQYQIQELQRDLALVNSHLRDLNLEASSIRDKETAVKAAVEAAKSETEKKEGN